MCENGKPQDQGPREVFIPMSQVIQYLRDQRPDRAYSLRDSHDGFLASYVRKTFDSRYVVGFRSFAEGTDAYGNTVTYQFDPKLAGILQTQRQRNRHFIPAGELLARLEAHAQQDQ